MDIKVFRCGSVEYRTSFKDAMWPDQQEELIDDADSTSSTSSSNLAAGLETIGISRLDDQPSSHSGESHSRAIIYSRPSFERTTSAIASIRGASARDPHTMNNENAESSGICRRSKHQSRSDAFKSSGAATHSRGSNRFEQAGARVDISSCEPFNQGVPKAVDGGTGSSGRVLSAGGGCIACGACGPLCSHEGGTGGVGSVFPSSFFLINPADSVSVSAVVSGGDMPVRSSGGGTSADGRVGGGLVGEGLVGGGKGGERAESAAGGGRVRRGNGGVCEQALQTDEAPLTAQGNVEQVLASDRKPDVIIVAPSSPGGLAGKAGNDVKERGLCAEIDHGTDGGKDRKGPDKTDKNAPTSLQSKSLVAALGLEEIGKAGISGKASKGKPPPPPGGTGATPLEPEADDSSKEIEGHLAPCGKGAPPPPPGGKGGPPPPGGKGGPQPLVGKGIKCSDGGKGKDGKGKNKKGKTEPRKADVLPNVQTKKLYWTPFRLDIDAGTIWDEIDRDTGGIDTKELDSLFADIATSRMSKCVSNELGDKTMKNNGKAVVKKVKIFDDDRRRQLLLMMARLPKANELCKILQDMDMDRLNRDQAELLCMNLPTAEETQLLRTAQDNMAAEVDSQWDIAEACVVSLIGIPQYQLRLQLWNFQQDFPARCATIAAIEMASLRGCETMLTSVAIRHVLRLVLLAGNYLNGGTPRGRADGFSVDVLLQLKTIKATKTTPQEEGAPVAANLVDYVVLQMEQTYPEELEPMLGPNGPLEIFSLAAKVKLLEARDELKHLGKQAVGMLQALCHGEDAQLARHREIMAMCSSELEALEWQMFEVERRFKELCTFFNCAAGGNQKTTDEFFSTWESFLKDLDRSYKVMVAARKKALVRRRARTSIDQVALSSARARAASVAAAPADGDGQETTDNLFAWRRGRSVGTRSWLRSKTETDLARTLEKRYLLSEDPPSDLASGTPEVSAYSDQQEQHSPRPAQGRSRATSREAREAFEKKLAQWSPRRRGTFPLLVPPPRSRRDDAGDAFGHLPTVTCALRSSPATVSASTEELTFARALSEPGENMNAPVGREGLVGQWTPQQCHPT